MGITAERLKGLGIVDKVIDEPLAAPIAIRRAWPNRSVANC